MSEAIRIVPGDAVPGLPSEDVAALNLRGKAACQAGRIEEGIALFRRALAAVPTLPETHFNLGRAQHEQGRLDEAIDSYRRAVNLEPEQFSAHFNLANTQRDRGDLDEAIASYRRAVSLGPEQFIAHFNLANMLRGQGKLDEAIASYRQAVALGPDRYSAHLNLAKALWERGLSTEAAASYWRTITLNPDDAQAYNGLAMLLWSTGRANEVAAHLRRALELAPDKHFLRSNLLACLQYDPEMTPGALLVEHRAYGASLSGVAQLPHRNALDPDRRLNIGYVSPDLHQHPIGFFLLPVLAAHDKANFAVHCYCGHQGGDGITAVLKSRADVWRSTDDADDEALAAMIRADGIDILVDLAGHTKGNRLPAFARRPAPVQATWAGYVGTTGLEAIDYLITDRWQNPPGSERYAVETLMRLPDGYICWAAPAHAPDVGPLPATAPGVVTFGCFNSFGKINLPVIALWARLLRELPASRLVLKAGALADAAVRQRSLALFEAEGIDASRIVLEGPSPHPELLQRYNDIDIALDPFPYSGGVTTIEALWMGVPVVTQGGERFCSRHSLSHLNNVGLAELIADGPAAYLRIAAELARDLPRLAALRAGLRDRVRSSPLLQGRRFTRGLEAAFRTMWRIWCRNARERDQPLATSGGDRL